MRTRVLGTFCGAALDDDDDDDGDGDGDNGNDNGGGDGEGPSCSPFVARVGNLKVSE